MRTSTSVYNFQINLCLSTYETAYTICFTCHHYNNKVSRFFKTGKSEGKHMIVMQVIFDINYNIMFEVFLSWNHVISQFNYWKNMNIDTRTLCMYKSIFNLTLKQIWDLCTINNQFEQHANHSQLVNFSKASWNTPINLFSAMISKPNIDQIVPLPWKQNC